MRYFIWLVIFAGLDLLKTKKGADRRSFERKLIHTHTERHIYSVSKVNWLFLLYSIWIWEYVVVSQFSVSLARSVCYLFSVRVYVMLMPEFASTYNEQWQYALYTVCYNILCHFSAYIFCCFFLVQELIVSVFEKVPVTFRWSTHTHTHRTQTSDIETKLETKCLCSHYFPLLNYVEFEPESSIQLNNGSLQM